MLKMFGDKLGNGIAASINRTSGGCVACAALETDHNFAHIGFNS
jgi:hypothetical protein